MEHGAHTTAESYTLAYSIMDSSRVSTFFISILLIVYGSFRSLSMEDGNTEEGEEKEKKESNVTTLDSLQAMCLPLGASFSLLIMFFFFDSMQVRLDNGRPICILTISLQLLFAVCTAVIATVALAFLLLPMCQYLVRPCSTKGKISLGVCGRFTLAEILSVAISICVVCVWVLTGHWALMDFMGMGLCVAFIAFVRLPSLKVSTLLLSGLLLYDVFWVFFSQVRRGTIKQL